MSYSASRARPTPPRPGTWAECANPVAETAPVKSFKILSEREIAELVNNSAASDAPEEQDGSHDLEPSVAPGSGAACRPAGGEDSQPPYWATWDGI